MGRKAAGSSVVPGEMGVILMVECGAHERSVQYLNNGQLASQAAARDRCRNLVLATRPIAVSWRGKLPTYLMSVIISVNAWERKRLGYRSSVSSE